MAVRLTPTEAAKNNPDLKPGWLRLHVVTQLELMRQNNRDVKLPVNMNYGGYGDEMAYISYGRNAVRDLILKQFANDPLVDVDIN